MLAGRLLSTQKRVELVEEMSSEPDLVTVHVLSFDSFMVISP
jgi:hypothetical protein